MDRLIEIAEEFGRIISYIPIKEKTKIEEIMLYGSLARGKTGKDIDLLLIHHNSCLDIFQNLIKSGKYISYPDSVVKLSQILKLDIMGLFKGTKVKQAIIDNLIQTNYMNKKYFQDEKYQERWDKQNINPNFVKNIFSYGLLWNCKTEKYDIPAKRLYPLVKQQQNQFLP